MNEGYVYQNFSDERKLKSKYKLEDLVRTADKENTFSKGDTTNWSHKLYTITDVIINTIPT